MTAMWIAIAVVVGLAAVAACWHFHPRRLISSASHLSRAKRRFHVERERLEAKFVQLASARAKVDTPRWNDCNFADDVAYVRNRTSGELAAFVAVTIATETANEYDRSNHAMHDDISHHQAGTAVFRFDRDHWVTDGRAILNLTPTEAVDYYHNDFEIIAEEFAHR